MSAKKYYNDKSNDKKSIFNSSIIGNIKNKFNNLTNKFDQSFTTLHTPPTPEPVSISEVPQEVDKIKKLNRNTSKRKINNFKRKDLHYKLAVIMGAKVKDLRKEYKITRYQLSEFLGISEQQLAKYENGINSLGPVYILILSEIFDKDLEYFYSSKLGDIRKKVTLRSKRDENAN